VADTLAISWVMVTQMEQKGDPRVFAAIVSISGSAQALLVPPSHNAAIYRLAYRRHDLDHQIVYGLVTCNLLPGASLIVLWLVLAYRNGHRRGETVGLREAVRIAFGALSGADDTGDHPRRILGGVFTAIEAGAVACLRLPIFR
jgi:TRAP-type C4-dicarboxylate transport system permease large subunit